MNYQYRKKPVVIEAILSIHVMEHMAGAGTTIPQWAYDAVNNGEINADGPNSPLKIETLEGVMTAKIDDFIIRGVKGEIYPCKPDIFAETYDAVGEDDETDEGDRPIPIGNFPILSFFEYNHLPAHLQKISKPLCKIADDMASGLHPSAELAAGLRKLLEAKDCFVRASINDGVDSDTP